MPLISASLKSPILLHSLSNRSLNPRFIFSTFLDSRAVVKQTFSFRRVTRAYSNMSGDGVAQFNLSPTSLLKIQKGDITRWFIDGSSDAVVNPANERMLGGGGADGACYDVPEVRPGVRCPTGEARITPGFKLPASHVIHTVGPVYDVDSNAPASLSNAYRNSLRVARENNIQYVAFPAISCGVYGYPFDEAAAVAISTIKEHCDAIKEVHFVLFSDDIYNVWLKKAGELLPNSHI